MADIFISYSRKDIEFARQLYQALTDNEYDVWVDWEDIPLTADWWQEICAGIEGANAFIFIVSPDSVASQICNLELAHALSNNKRLVPIVRRQTDQNQAFDDLSAQPVDDIVRAMLNGRDDILAIARDNWRQAVGTKNWIFFDDDSQFETRFAKLVHAVNTDLDYVRDHTRLFLKATEWHAKNRDSSLLLRDSELDDAQTWLLQNGSQKEPHPHSLHIAHIQASEKAQARRQRNLFASVSLALVIMTGLAILSFLLFRQSENRRVLSEQRGTVAAEQGATAVRRSDEIRSLLLSSGAEEAILANNNDLAVSLALKANEMTDPPVEAQNALVNAASSSWIKQRYFGHTDAVSFVSFAPDGKSALSASSQEVIWWDVASGGILKHYVQYQWPAKISPDGHHAIAQNRETGEMVFWELKTGQEILTISVGAVLDVSFRPDQKFALIDSWDGITLWNLTTNESTALLDLMDYDRGMVSYLRAYHSQFLPGQPAIIFSMENHAIVMDIATKRKLREIQMVCSVESLDLSQDGRTALISACDHDLLLWDLETNESQQQHWDNTFVSDQAVLSPDTNQIYVGADDGIVLLNAQNQSLLRRYRGPGGPVVSLAVSPDGSTLLTGMQDGSLILWDLQITDIAEQFKAESGPVFGCGVAISPDGKLLASSAERNKVLVWEIPSGRLLFTLDHPSPVAGVAFHPTKPELLTAAIRTLYRWNMVTGELIDTTSSDGSDNTNSYPVAYSHDGQMVAVGNGGGDIIFFEEGKLTNILSIKYEVNTGDGIYRNPMAHTQPVNSLAFNPDDRLLVSSSEDQTARVWDVTTGALLQTLAEHTQAVTRATFSSDGEKILTSSEDHSLILWDVQTGEVLQRFEGHTGEISDAVFNQDSTRILSVSTDGSMTLWNAGNGAIIQRFWGNFSNESRVFFVPSTNLALTINGNGQITLWDIHLDEDLVAWTANNRYVPELSCDQRKQFGVEPLCDDGVVIPTRTPYPTLVMTPTPPGLVTSAPLPVVIATPSPIPTLQLDFNRALVLGPRDGSIEHHAEDGVLSFADGGIAVQNFEMEVTVMNPYPISYGFEALSLAGIDKGLWDFGVAFRVTGENQSYNLVIHATREWRFYWINGNEFEVLDQGFLPNLDISDDGSNQLRLIIYGDTGEFYLNDQKITALDVSKKQVSGDIELPVGYYSEITGISTYYKDFTVWELTK